MALIPRSIRRPSAILKMPQAIARGLTASAYLKQLQKQGLGYRKTLFLSDWRSIAGIEAKKDRVKYVRKDRRPSMRAIADVEWELSQEYMYKVKVMTRVAPDEPLKERFVNIMSDRVLTPAEVEKEVFGKWASWEKYQPEKLELTTVAGIYHRVELPFTEED